MISPGQELPLSEDVNVAILSRLFLNTTNSYKYLFFASTLDILNRRGFEVSQSISLQAITIELLANAWYPHNYFRLSFGSQDKIADQLDKLDLQVSEPVLNFTDTDKQELRRAIASQDLESLIKKTMRFVPFRILRPFFERELRGIKDYKINELIAVLSESRFLTQKPLFRFCEDLKGILIHPSWGNYIKRNYSIVRGWASWEWLKYMQKCNPNVPAVSEKLYPPHNRESLSSQLKYWKLILKHTQLNCIYSGEILTPTNISLDHYLPWSFVAHNRIWNLIPTLPNVNSSKSRNIPSQVYLDPFVINHHIGLRVSQMNMSKHAWTRVVEPYIADLRIKDTSELFNLDILSKAYKDMLTPLISLAENQGFSTGWKYD